MSAQSDYEKNDVAAGFKAFGHDAGGEKDIVWQALTPLIPQASHLLDFGCGTGWLALRAAQQLGAKAVGYDPAQPMIDAAIADNVDNKVFFTTDLTAVAARQPFDIAAMLFVVPAISQRGELDNAFASMADGLKPGGIAYVVTANPDALDKPHAFFMNTLPTDIHDGTPYGVTLRAHDGKTLATVTDHFWSGTTVLEAASKAGLEAMGQTPLADTLCQPGTPLSDYPYRLYSFRRG